MVDPEEQEEREDGPVRRLVPPGEPVHGPREALLGEWTEEIEDEYMEDLKDLTEAEQRAKEHHTNLSLY